MKRVIGLRVIGLRVIGLRVIGLIVSVFMLAGCANEPDAQTRFAELDHEQAILQAHQWYRNDQNIVVHVLADQIRATFGDGSESTVAIPEDKFFLSIAPWVTFTHPCTFHVPTGCTGELVGKEMKVTARDVETGEIVIDQMITTQHDGFIDFWVPSQRHLAFVFEYEDERFGLLTAKEVLSTHPDGQTCITTMQLTTAS